MKNFLLITALLCIAFTTQAQFTTGQKMIGGQIAGTFSDNRSDGAPSSDKTSNIGLSLSLSKFKSPTSYRSFGIAYTNYHRTTRDFSAPADDGFKANTNYFDVFFDNTKLLPLAKNFYFTYTGTVGAGVQFGKNTTTGGTTVAYNNYNSYVGFVNGNIGLLYGLTPRFLFTCNLANLLSISVAHTDSKSGFSSTVPVSSHQNSFAISTGLTGLSLNSISIGAKYMLKK
jgi:hypothetical protein